MASKLNWFTAASVIVAAVSGAGAAHAQQAQTEASGRGLDEIIVTAQRREQSVQDVPIAVTAFSPDQLEDLNITKSLQLAQFVPNMIAMNNTGLGSANAYFLRGLGNTESIATFDPPVGTYIDDVYLTRQNANNFAFFDLSRIEVLRGPQGTLFGRNTTGGAVNVILKKPADEFGGFMEFAAGDFDATEARLSVDVPINAAVRTKLSGYAGDRAGYAKNVTTGETVNGDEYYGLRGAVAVDVSEALSWDGAWAHVYSDNLNLLNFECSPLDPTVCGERYVATGLATGLNTANGRFATTVPVSGPKGGFGLGNEVTTDLFTSNLNWDLGGASLNFITGYLDLEQDFAIDFFDGRTGSPGFTFAGAVPVGTVSNAQFRPPVSGGPNGTFTITNEGKHRQFTQEVKLSGATMNDTLQYQAGLYFLDEDNKTNFADIFFTTLLADRLMQNRTRAYAAYVQGDWRIAPQLLVTAGVRYTDEEKKISFDDLRPACAANQAAAGCLSSGNIVNTPFTSGARIPLKQKTELATPRVAVNYEPTDDLLFFASATRGFKSGGWNPRGTAVNELLPFDPELVWSYEAGMKSEWYDGRLRFNATYFLANTEDLQTISAFVRANGTIAFITRNFADLENRGWELELTAQPLSGLTIFGNVGLQDAEYEIDAGAATFDKFGVLSTGAQQRECQAALGGLASPGLVGASFSALTPAVRAQRTCGQGIVTPQGTISKPVRSPDTTVSAGFTYEWDFGPNGRLIPTVSATYFSDQEVGTSNVTIFANGSGLNLNDGVVLTGSRSEATALINAGMAWENEAGNLRFSVDCTNCGDEATIQSTLGNFSYLSPPRQWMARLKADF